MDICFVTSNRSKVMEIEHALDTKLDVVPLNLPEMQAINVSDVLTDKAKRAYMVLKRPVIVEDTGLYIKALNNFPGALIKMLLDRVGNEGICRIMRGFGDRRAYAESGFCLYDGRSSKVFLGRADGTIAKRPRRGINDFGWNSIFIPKGHKKTYSEMTIADKNKISMRAKAVKKLQDYLKNKKSVPEEDDEGRYTEEFKASLSRGLTDIRKKRTYSSSELKRRLEIYD